MVGVPEPALPAFPKEYRLVLNAPYSKLWLALEKGGAVYLSGQEVTDPVAVGTAFLTWAKEYDAHLTEKNLAVAN